MTSEVKAAIGEFENARKALRAARDIVEYRGSNTSRNVRFLGLIDGAVRLVEVILDRCADEGF